MSTVPSSPETLGLQMQQIGHIPVSPFKTRFAIASRKRDLRAKEAGIATLPSKLPKFCVK